MTPNSSTINFDPAIPTDWEKSTYYVRDAQGNVMAIYEYTIDDVTQDNHYTLTERNIYGSSRLGNNNAPVEMIATTPPNPSQYSHHIGYRQYELSNHLGNVLAVLSDRKIARDTDQDNTVDYYEPDVLLTYDYSPFGAPLHARSFTKEVCDEITTTQVIEDLNTNFNDATTQGWTAIGNTTLSVTSNEQLKIEETNSGQPLGATQSFMAVSGELYDFTITIDKGNCTADASILLEVLDINNTVIYTQTLNNGTQTYTTQFTAGTSGAYTVTVERINDASNCYFLIDDVLITHEEDVTDIVCEDFAGYRYGFNGMEKDDEISGSGNNYDFGARMYDPRLGRWMSIDPYEKMYTPISPYTFAINNPIKLVDADGNVVTDENGNPVTISAPVKQEDGTYTSTFIFVEGTSMEVADNFTNNGGRVINALIQVESGREIVAKADQSADNIHITISPEILHLKEKVDGRIKESAKFGKTKIETIIDKENRTIKRQGFEVVIYEGTINSVSEDNTSQIENKQLYAIDKLNQDQKVAITGAHELDHATNPDQVKLQKSGNNITEEQHQETRNFQKKVSGEFGVNNSKNEE